MANAVAQLIDLVREILCHSSSNTIENMDRNNDIDYLYKKQRHYIYGIKNCISQFN